MKQIKLVYQIVFSSDMLHPITIRAEHFLDFLRLLEDAVIKYGQFEMIYRIY